MLSHVGVSKDFWAEVINTACYLVNPFEVWSGLSVDCKHLIVFGCPAYAQ